METHERYFGKIFADLIKQLVEEDESTSSHLDGQTLLANLRSSMERALPPQPKPETAMPSHYAANVFSKR
jgi:hypothetical protein